MNKFENLIGEIVSHTNESLGNGKIVGCDDNYITIQFHSHSKHDKSLKFKFPQIFFDKRQLLTTNSSILKNIIEKERDAHMCSKCNSYSETIYLIETQKLCGECKSKLVRCSQCEKLYDTADCICTDEYYKTYECKNCYEDAHFLCPICGETVCRDIMISSPYILDGIAICERCAEDEYFTCDVCNTWMSGSVSVDINDYYSLCPKCALEKVTICSLCGQQMIIKSNSSTPICPSCQKEHEYLNYIETLNLSSMKAKNYSFDAFKKMRTKKIMSRLRHYYDSMVFSSITEDKESFDVLLLSVGDKRIVVISDLPQDYRNINSYGCTLSELKKNGCFHLIYGNTCTIEKVKKLANGNYFHIWKQPYKLRAMTFADMNYGDRRYGDEVDEGNKYGDTSDFFIIGFIDKNKRGLLI